MGAVGTEEAVDVPNSSMGLFQQEQDRQSLLSSCWKRGGRGGNRIQCLSFLCFICMYFLDGFSCSDSTSVSPWCPVCDCSLLIEEEGGCRHVPLVKRPLTFLLTCLNKYISKPVLFERAAHKD